MTDRELDALVAEKVFGFTRQPGDPEMCEIPSSDAGWRKYKKIDPYSTDIAAAWLVALYLQRGGHIVDIGTEYHEWVAIIDDNRKYMAKDARAPRAICIAALKERGVTVPE